MIRQILQPCNHQSPSWPRPEGPSCGGRRGPTTVCITISLVNRLPRVRVDHRRRAPCNDRRVSRLCALLLEVHCRLGDLLSFLPLEHRLRAGALPVVLSRIPLRVRVHPVEEPADRLTGGMPPPTFVTRSAIFSRFTALSPPMSLWAVRSAQALICSRGESAPSRPSFQRLSSEAIA